MSDKIEKRNIVVYLLLTIFTCGIFGIYWIICLIQDTSKVSDEKMSAGVVILLSIITFGIYGMYWNYKMGKLLYKAGKSYNADIEDNSILYLILSIFGFAIINYCLMQNSLNILSDKYVPATVVVDDSATYNVKDDNNDGPIKQ